mgnify:CR=1 FL=1
MRLVHTHTLNRPAQDTYSCEKLVEEERMGSADCDLGSVVVLITHEKPVPAALFAVMPGPRAMSKKKHECVRNS